MAVMLKMGTQNTGYAANHAVFNVLLTLLPIE
jgi:hypothetical protein